MFDSKCCLSKDGPLGAIWVAAYCFKKLKKAQVTSTDISSSVDKIVQEEFDVVTYRVLAHLLLGVVRIYSKKVDYLFNDCNKVVIQIKDFVARYNKNNPILETLCAPSSFASIILPKRFELDSFELDILEDHCGRNVSSLEDITLKDCAWKRKEIGWYSMEKGHYEDFSACQQLWISDHIVDRDMFEAHLPELNMGASTSLKVRTLGSNQKNIHGNKSAGDKFVEQNFDTWPEEEPLETVDLLGDNNKKEGRNRNSPEVLQSDEIGAEETQDGDQGNSFYKRDSDPGRFYDVEKKPAGAGIQSVKDNQIEEQHTQSQILDPVLKHQFNGDHCDVGEMEASMEKLQEHRVNSEECMNVNVVHMVEELHVVLHEQCIHPKALKFTGTNSEGEDKSQTVSEGHLLSIPLDVTPQSGFPDSSSKMRKNQLSVSVDATPQSKFPNPPGGSMPDFLVIPTPARSERRQHFRKRKCLYDDDIVIPNKVLKHIIEDASDLITKRRKVPHTAFAAWKASRVYDLPRTYLEPLIPCSSLHFGSLSCKKRLKTLELADAVEHSENCRAEHSVDGKSVGNTDMLEHLHLPDSCTISGSAKKRDDDSRLPQSPTVGGAMDAVETLGNIDVPSTTKDDDASVHQVPIAPGTPVQRSSMVRPFASPERQAASVTGIPIFENQEKVLHTSKDEEFFNDLLNKEINTSEADDEFHDKLSERTRSVGQCLHRIFSSRKERNAEEEVNLMQLLEQRSRKESARIFYEILVLKTKGFVDVEQEHPYGDILVCETDKLNQAFEVYIQASNLG